MVGIGARRKRLRQIDIDVQMSLLERCGVEVDRRDDRGAQVDLAPVTARGRRHVTLRERIERAGEPNEPIHLLVQRLECRTLRRDDAVSQRLEVSLQICERRSQLVRRVGHEFASHTLLLFDLASHPVERLGERTHFGRTAIADSDRVVSLREQPRSLAHLGERRRDAASDDDRERDAHRRGDDEGSYEEHHDAVAEHRLSARDGFAVLDHDLRERPAAEDERADREHGANEQRDRSHGDRDLSAEAEALHLSMTAR